MCGNVRGKKKGKKHGAEKRHLFRWGTEEDTTDDKDRREKGRGVEDVPGSVLSKQKGCDFMGEKTREKRFHCGVIKRTTGREKKSCRTGRNSPTAGEERRGGAHKNCF